MSRFVLEGEWSGYTSAQQRVVHREVVTEKRAKVLGAKYGIRYTDGTMLYLSVREAKPREKVNVLQGYSDLIRDCEHYNVWSVSELMRAREAVKQAVLGKAGE